MLLYLGDGCVQVLTEPIVTHRAVVEFDIGILLGLALLSVFNRYDLLLRPCPSGVFCAALKPLDRSTARVLSWAAVQFAGSPYWRVVFLKNAFQMKKVAHR